MFKKTPAMSIAVLVGLWFPMRSATADEVLYRYDGDVFPYEVGWEIFNPCEPPCSESLDNGRFNLHWSETGDLTNYTYVIAQSADPPATLWVEWQFRSNHPKGPNYYGCDGRFTVRYSEMLQKIYLYGDAAIPHSGGGAVTGLDIEEFHTYRFESLDGANYTVAVDGQVFVDGFDDISTSITFLQFGGEGGCLQDWFPNMINEWDFVWYGTISTGEQIVATDPPAGNLDPQTYSNLDRFTVTFDSPNYVYLDDITVEVTGGTAPIVTSTHRLDNGEPDVVEIVLDGPLPLNERTTFIFNDGETMNSVSYILGELPPIPVASEWGITIMMIVLLTAGTIILGRVLRNTKRA